MKLNSAHIRHFKSLHDVQLDLDPRVTLLVGPNAVGKSNVVDALRFVRDAASDGLDHAVTARGGITRIRQFSRSKPYKIGIALDIGYSSNDRRPQPRTPWEFQTCGTYSFSVLSQLAGNYLVDHETAKYKTINASDNGQSVEPLGQFQRDASGATQFSGRDSALQVPKDQLALTAARLSVGSIGSAMLSHYIGTWQFSAIFPNRLRVPTHPVKDHVLAEDGGNWASVIRAMRRSQKGRADLERIGDAVRTFMPSFVDVTVAAVGGFLVPNFVLQQGASGTATFDPSQLSDGTLRLFGLLLALYQLNPPTLLVIEEPELTVHPGALSVLVEAFREASERTQIIVTTHSPQLVDHFEPEQVRVVSLDAGSTRVGPIRAAQMESVKEQLMSLQEFMAAEGLQAEPA